MLCCHRSCRWARERRLHLEEFESRLVPSTLPQPAHVVIVVEENHSFSDMIGSPAAPYINSLAQQGALMTNSFAVEHPSQPNYLDLFSGSNQGVTDDSFPHRFSTPNLASALLGAGLTFGGYSQSMPGVGFTGAGGSSNTYAGKHNPWVNFTNVPAADNMPFEGYFPAAFSQLPTVSIIVPDLNNDMHTGGIQQGDAWLRVNIDAYAQWAKSNNSLVIVTWDEDDYSQNNRIATILVGAIVTPGSYNTPINHWNVLRTLEDMYHLPYAGASASVTPLTGMWQNSVADENFVQSLYNDYLGRNGSLAELDGWARRIGQLGRGGVANDIARSTEGLTRLVDSFYSTFLNRPADGPGENAWVRYLLSGGTEEQMAMGFFSSPEFATVANQLGGTGDGNINFVEALYSLLLHRTPNNNEVNAWLNVLGTYGRTVVARGFVYSGEFRGDAVATFYGDPNQRPLPAEPFFANLLRRSSSPAASEITGWVGTGLDLLSIEIAFAGSQEYYNQAQGR